ncbi:MAG: transposase [Bacteroidetes bacterium]|nr:transposase [Bacteroidota bacterium]
MVIDIGEGRDKVSTKMLLNRLMAAKKEAITTITTDMWKAYMNHGAGTIPRGPSDPRSLSFDPVPQQRD